MRGFAATALLGAVGLAGRRLDAPDTEALADWRGFSTGDVELLSEIAEVILPETDTPGARTAGVGAFIALAVAECFDDERQAVVVAGLRDLEVRAGGRGFLGLSGDARLALLSEIRGEQTGREWWDRGRRGVRRLARTFGVSLPIGTPPPHYLALLIDLAVIGFCTSEPGASAALRHLAIPGDYNGDLPYREGDRAWSM